MIISFICTNCAVLILYTISGNLEGVTKVKNHAEKTVNGALKMIGEAILREPNDLYKIMDVSKTHTADGLQIAIDKLRKFI